jgi:hypothetical protein
MNNFSSDFSAEDLHVEDDEDDESMYVGFSFLDSLFGLIY